MSEKEELKKMLDAIIDDKSEQAQVHFHTYLGDKMKDELYDTDEDNEDED